MVQKSEILASQPSDVLRIIPDWKKFFKENASHLQQQVIFIAKGGTIDSILDQEGLLTPLHHPVTIEKTIGFSAMEIEEEFKQYALNHRNLGALFPWTAEIPDKIIPWREVKVKQALRISSFDSGQEQNSHLLATLKYVFDMLEKADNICVSGGTDSLAKIVSLCTVILTPYLIKNNKKIIFQGSPESGYEQNSLAVSNITGGLYATIENNLSGGVYTITTSKKEEDKAPAIHILTGLGTVKLHSDGYFYSPNSTPILTIKGNTVHKYPIFDDLKERVKQWELLPDLSAHYLNNSEEFHQLEQVMQSTRIETVENDIPTLDKLYEMGIKTFLIKARGSGTGSTVWKKAIETILGKGDTTVFIITLADQGDVTLDKYKAGLYLPKILSGRTLREETGFVFAVLSHELVINHGYSIKNMQELIDRYCWLSGILE